MDRLTEKQIKHHLDKVALLSREYTTRKDAGLKRIQKMENELKMELDRIQTQIDSHRSKASELATQQLPQSPQQEPQNESQE